MVNWREWKQVPKASRPKIRWWLPSTVIDIDAVLHELHMLKDAGFAGAEIAPQSIRHPATGCEEKGWNVAEWYDILHKIFEEANRIDFEIDLMILSSSPSAWPVIADVNDPSQGVRLELDGECIDGITKEHPYEGRLPVSDEAVKDAAVIGGKAELYAVTVAKYMDKENHILAFDSARELVIGKEVQKCGEDTTSYTVSFMPEDKGEYVLFAWWLHPAEAMAAGIPQLDYIGKCGTKRLIEGLDCLLFDRLSDVSQCLGSLFCDSIEWTSHLDFCVGFREMFCEKYGYDIIKYLPALYEKKGSCVYRDPVPDFRFEKNSDQLLRAYGEFLTHLHVENHLKPLQQFCESRGVTLRYQTAYGKFFELSTTAGYVDIPDTETLYGKDIIDFYRLQSGAVNIKGKGLYAIEASAEAPGRGNGGPVSGNYVQGFKNQLWHLQRAYAAGVNQVYFHGLRYRGQYKGPGNEKGFLSVDVHWPGYDSMGFVFGCSNSWDERQPNWNGMKQLTDYLARVQYVLRQGRAKMDLAVYYHSYMEKLDCAGAEKILDTVVLEQLGYSYDIIGTEYLKEIAEYCDGTSLYPEGPAYQALIFHAQKALPARTVTELRKLAEKGFPIIFCGRVPNEPAFYGEEWNKEECQSLFEMDHVYLCENMEQLPEILSSCGVTPQVSYQKPEKVLNLHRETADTDYYYFYNYADADTYLELEGAKTATFDVKIKNTGTFYCLDPWTGSVTEAVPVASVDGNVILTLTIAPNDSMIVVADRSGQNPCDITEPVKVCGEAQPVKGWTLSVESWTEGDSPVLTKKEIVKTIELEDPMPWTQIEGLEKISGVGYYQTKIVLEKGWEDGVGAYLIIPKIEDCYQLTVNGVFVPGNQMAPTIDIGRYLKSGINQIEIAASSTLLNACVTYAKENGIASGVFAYLPCGMWGPVTIVPYFLRTTE